MCSVVNIRKHSHTVYIGRPSIFGNPFVVGKHGKRGECVLKFQEWFYSPEGKHCRDAVQKYIKKGDVLGCYCKPKSCHGDVIAAYVNNNYQPPSIFFEI